MTDKPIYLLVSVIAFVAAAHYREFWLYDIIFPFIGGACFSYGLIK